MRIWFVRASRLINRFVYKEPCMLCSSLYWHMSPKEKVFNRIFFWHKKHCRRCFSYDFHNHPRYYQYLMDSLKEKREKSMEKQMEFPFVGRPPSTCAECGELVHADEVIIKQFYTGTVVKVEHFCSHLCHHSYYIKRLNQMGM